MKVATVVGTRPQFIKSLVVSRALRKRGREVLVHTGQHYHWNMSRIFFAGLSLPEPDYHLKVGPGTPGQQLGRMLSRLEEVLRQEKPDFVLVYGDSRTTLAGAVAASRRGIPVVHVEAGLRCYNQSMPEEFNRLLTDHLSAVLFCSGERAARNLAAEGVGGVYRQGRLVEQADLPDLPPGQKVFNVGDVMYDTLLEVLQTSSGLPAKGRQEAGAGAAGEYLLATVHRAENTDKRERLAVILAGLAAACEKVVFPLHPRTAKMIKNFSLGGLLNSPHIEVIEPLDYRSMISLLKNARKVITDSGGVQKEAFFLKVPCITLREETEWVETVERGCNVLVGCDRLLLWEALQAEPAGDWSGFPYGRGDASLLLARILEGFL